MLKRPGYRDYVTSVIIPPGSRISFSAQLEPAIPEVPEPGSPQDPGYPGYQTGPGPFEGPGSPCDIRDWDPRVPVPVVTATPVPTPDPGLLGNSSVIIALISAVTVLSAAVVSIFIHLTPHKKE